MPKNQISSTRNLIYIIKNLKGSLEAAGYKEGDDLSAGEMARKLGISNGAVSQTLKRLEKKGVIKKTKDPALKNKVTATLTGFGQTAIGKFEERQEVTKKGFHGYLVGLSEGERKGIEGFLNHLDEFLRRLE